MALLDSDLLLVGRGGSSFRATAQTLKTYVESGDGLIFRGSVDLTAAPVINPNPPVVGDLYINNTAGTVNAGWAGAANSATDVGDRVLWDGTEWDLITSSQDVGVTDVSETAPITDTALLLNLTLASLLLRMLLKVQFDWLMIPIKVMVR